MATVIAEKSDSMEFLCLNFISLALLGEAVRKVLLCVSHNLLVFLYKKIQPEK